jgi:hypothetical protein
MSTFDLGPLKQTLARSIKDVLYPDTVTPSGKPIPCEIYIPYNHIHEADDEPNTATMSVTYVVKCPEEKKHTVNIKCKYDQKGKYVTGSMSYI